MNQVATESNNQSRQLSIDTENSETAPLCANCGIELNGKFCHQCGQSSRSVIKFFGEVIKELLDDVIGYDSRLQHSIIPLLFQPGKLSAEYIQGRRFYYVRPFRLYLFTSILFIIALQFTTSGVDFLPEEIQQSTTEAAPTTLPTNQNKDLNNNAPLTAQTNLDNITQSYIDASMQKTANIAQANKETNDKKKVGPYFHVNENGLTINPNKPPSSSKFINISTDNLKLKQIMNEINAKAESWKKDPSPLLNEFFNLFPYMMFIILPVFAIFSKIFYLFSKRYYVEHLIFSLHNHSFIYLVMIVEISLEALQSWTKTATFTGASVLYEMMDWINLLIILWIIAYIFIATKRFYQQGWVMTISKTFALGIIYLLLSSVGLMLTLVIGAYLA